MTLSVCHAVHSTLQSKHCYRLTDYIYTENQNSFFFFFFLGLQHREVPSLRVELELQLPAYTTATARPDPSCICKLHHSLEQRQIINLLNEARDQTHIFMDTMLGSETTDPQ